MNNSVMIIVCWRQAFGVGGLEGFSALRVPRRKVYVCFAVVKVSVGQVEVSG